MFKSEEELHEGDDMKSTKPSHFRQDLRDEYPGWLFIGGIVVALSLVPAMFV